MSTDADDITEAYREVYDAKREVFVPDALSLILLSYEQSTQEAELISITDGWNLKQSEDASTSSVTVLITDRVEIDDTLMNSVARFQIEERTYRVETGGITPPLLAPYVWQVRGEEIRDNA